MRFPSHFRGVDGRLTVVGFDHVLGQDGVRDDDQVELQDEAVLGRVVGDPEGLEDPLEVVIVRALRDLPPITRAKETVRQ